MKVRLVIAAEWDLADGAEFYERQEAGAGAYFLKHLEAEIRALAQTAGIHRKRFRSFHCALAMPRFPYAIYYRITNGEVVVHAVLDERRDPATLQQILRDRSDP
jgi:plasmid stabilization system protein ParE